MKHLMLVFTIILLNTPVFSQNEATFGGIKPGMVNREIERQAIRVANKRCGDFGWQEEYYRAVIISHEWQRDLDKNGFLKGRKIHIELLAKKPNGKCVMADFTFRQKLLGDGTFSQRLIYDGTDDLVYVDCE